MSLFGSFFVLVKKCPVEKFFHWKQELVVCDAASDRDSCGATEVRSLSLSLRIAFVGFVFFFFGEFFVETSA